MIPQNEKTEVPEVYDVVDTPSYKMRLMKLIYDLPQEELKKYFENSRMDFSQQLKLFNKFEERLSTKLNYLEFFSNMGEESCKIYFNSFNALMKLYPYDDGEKMLTNFFFPLIRESFKTFTF